MSRPNTNDYPIYANGKGKHERFKLYFAKDFTNIKNLFDGDSFLITYWDHSDSYTCCIKIGAIIKGSGGFKRAWLTKYSHRKETKRYDTKVRFENGVLHTWLPHIKEISIFSTQNISIQFSFQKYNSSVWERAEWERKNQEKQEKEKALQEERYREYIETANKKKEEKLIEIRKIWVKINQEVLDLISEHSLTYMKMIKEDATPYDACRLNIRELYKTVNDIRQRKELRKELREQAKEQAAAIRKKYQEVLSKLEYKISSNVIKGANPIAWYKPLGFTFSSYEDSIKRFGLKTEYYAAIDDIEGNGLMKLEENCKLSFSEYEMKQKFGRIANWRELL